MPQIPSTGTICNVILLCVCIQIEEMLRQRGVGGGQTQARQRQGFLSNSRSNVIRGGSLVAQRKRIHLLMQEIWV